MSLSKLLKAHQTPVIPAGKAIIPIHNTVAQSHAASLATEQESSADEQLIAVSERCQQMIREAEDRCQTLIKEAEQRVHEIEGSAHASGFQAGYAEGKQQADEAAEKEWQDRILQLEAYMSSAEATRRKMINESDQVLVRVTMEAVRQLLHRELSTAPADIEGMVLELLQYVSETMKVEIRVHPEDFVYATEAHPRWKTAKFGEWEIVVIPDARIGRGGCQIRSDHGRIDATIETKLGLLEAALTDVMQRSVRDDVHSDAITA